MIQIRIIGTSDTHGMFYPHDYTADKPHPDGSLCHVKTAVDVLRTDNTLIIDAGDTIQGNEARLFLHDDAHPMIEAMNVIGYDVVTVGNHEFNYGVDAMATCYGKLNATTVNANVKFLGLFDCAEPNVIIERSGMRIGLFGLVTPNIKENDAANLLAYELSDTYEAVREQVQQLRDQVDLLVAIVHMDIESAPKKKWSGTRELAEAFPEIDVIMGSHGHKLISQEIVNGVLITENDCNARSLSCIDITLRRASQNSEDRIVNRPRFVVEEKTSRNYLMTEFEPDQDLMRMLEPFHQRGISHANEIIGIMEPTDLCQPNEIKGIPDAQLMDTPLTTLLNNVVRHYSGAMVSCVPIFSIDSNIPSGSIVRKDVSKLYKFDNTLYSCILSGQMLRQIMEFMFTYYNQFQPEDLTVSFTERARLYNYLMFGGVRYEIDISKPSGSRLKSLAWPDGTPITDDEEFLFAAPDFVFTKVLYAEGRVFATENDMPWLEDVDIAGDIGSIKALIAEYIKTKHGGHLAPECDHLWRVVGTEWNQDLRKRVVDLINAEVLTVENSKNGRSVNIRAITEYDVRNAESQSAQA